MRGDEEGQAGRLLEQAVQACRPRLRQIRASSRLRRDVESRKGRKAADSMLPGKASHAFSSATVPQTDTGRQVEHTKALERTLVKELGKMTP